MGAHAGSTVSAVRPSAFPWPGLAPATGRWRAYGGRVTEAASTGLEGYAAVVADLDGVVTDTASLHQRAWKAMFDRFLEGRGGAPFTEEDYRRYVDGKPRFDGVRSFLGSRGIELPEGDAQDGPGADTVRGLGNRKNALFRELLEHEGATVYEDAVGALRRWRAAGLGTAMVSSSRNAGRVVETAGLGELFDVHVDGNVGEKLGLPGKPAPDYFLEAARRLGVDPARAVVLEDATSGVEAGKRGGFGLVVGVARGTGKAALERAGADRVVASLAGL